MYNIMFTPVSPEIQRRLLNINNDITPILNPGSIIDNTNSTVNNISQNETRNSASNNIVQLNQSVDNTISNINMIERSLMDTTNRNVTTSNNDEQDPQYSQRHQTLESDTRIRSNNLRSNTLGNSRASSNHSLNTKYMETPPDVVNINDIEDAIPSSSSISNIINNGNLFDNNSSISNSRSSLLSISESQQEEFIINSYIRPSEDFNNFSESTITSREVINNNNNNNSYENFNNVNHPNRIDSVTESNNRRPEINEVIYRLVEVSPGVFQMRGITVNNEGRVTPPVTTINRNIDSNENNNVTRNSIINSINNHTNSHINNTNNDEESIIEYNDGNSQITTTNHNITNSNSLEINNSNDSNISDLLNFSEISFNSSFHSPNSSIHHMNRSNSNSYSVDTSFRNENNINLSTTDERNQLIREIISSQQQYEQEQQQLRTDYLRDNETRISSNVHSDTIINNNSENNPESTNFNTNNNNRLSNSNIMLNTITSTINAITGSNNNLNTLNSSDLNINYSNIDRTLEETFHNSNRIHSILSSNNINNSNNNLNYSSSVSSSTELLNLIIRTINNQSNNENNSSTNNINENRNSINRLGSRINISSNQNSFNNLNSNSIERTLYGSIGNLQYRSSNSNHGSNLFISNIPRISLTHESSENSINTNEDSTDFYIIDSFLTQEIEKLLRNEISIPQFINEYEAYEVLNLLYGRRDSQNEERNRQNIIQQINQSRIHENSTLYILGQRLRNNIDINDPDFYEESIRQLMQTPFDPNNQDSISNLAQLELNRDRDLVRSYYSLGSSSNDSSNNSQVSLNHPEEINMTELSFNERAQTNDNGLNRELNINGQSISSSRNLFENSPYSRNSLSRNNETSTNQFIRSYRSQYENDFHRYFDENGNLREDPIEEDHYDHSSGSTHYYENMENPTMRRNSINMALFCGDINEVTATILGAESREIRQDLIFSLIRGVLAMRYQNGIEQSRIINRERSGIQRVIYREENGIDEDGIRPSSTIRYRINEAVER
ncbi:hypothetical protein H8356DRAFT_1743035 [Neocallimastix lanati (nom. inval.)]|nr:hypothetical protein H8356DRAFT_1743035 [Neocallimastix sp. JGI-2020a]